MSYKIGSIKTANDALDALRDELNNLGIGGEKKIANISFILQDYDKIWKPITAHFYLTLDRMWMVRNENEGWVKMYEQLKNDLLGNTENYRWRITNGEIEIKKSEISAVVEGYEQQEIELLNFIKRTLPGKLTPHTTKENKDYQRGRNEVIDDVNSLLDQIIKQA